MSSGPLRTSEGDDEYGVERGGHAHGGHHGSTRVARSYQRDIVRGKRFLMCLSRTRKSATALLS